MTPTVSRRLRFDLGHRPFLVLLELTRACALACRHCRAEAVRCADAGDLGTAQVQTVLDDLASMGAPRTVVVLTGGDPLEREDLAEIVAHGASRGLAMAVSPAGTPRASQERLDMLRRAGARTVSFSLDAGAPAVHDGLRGVDGSFEWTVSGCRAATSAGLHVQINTTVCADTLEALPETLLRVVELGAHLWSVFFLVPVGRGSSLVGLSADETEDVLAFLADVASLVPLKTTEAPAFRRVLAFRQRTLGVSGPLSRPRHLHADLHRRLHLLAGPSFSRALRGARGRRASPSGTLRSPLAVGDGRGVVFVSHRGDVMPSGFLPLAVGNVRDRPLSEIYAHAPLLRALRDPSMLRGRCGRCELAEVCGGSRAQAYAASGDPFAEDPTCAYDPPFGAAFRAGRAMTGKGRR